MVCSGLRSDVDRAVEQRRQERDDDRDHRQGQDRRSCDRGGVSRSSPAAIDDARRLPDPADLLDSFHGCLTARRRSRPSAGRPEQDQRHQERDDEEHPGERRAVRHLLEREEGLVEVQVVEQGLAARLAGAVEEDERHEEVLENRDHRQDQRVEDDRRHHRDRHVAELGPPAGAIDLGRVVQLGRDPAQAGEIDDDARPDAPDADDHEGRVDPPDVEQPAGRVLDADEPEELVDPAGIAEHVLPDQDACHERHDVGHETGGPGRGRCPGDGGC